MKYLTSVLFIIAFFGVGVGSELEKQQAPIIFGTTEAYPPFASVDADGTVYGFSVSFSQMLCKEMQRHCVYKPMSFNHFFPALQQHKIDAAIGAIAITAARQQQFALTLPYLPNRASNVAKIKPGEPRLTSISLAVAKQKVFGTQTASIFADVFEARYPNLKMKLYNKTLQLIAALEDGTVDVIILDTPVAEYWVNNTTPKQFYLVGKPFDLQSGIGIMLNKDNPVLLAQLNQAILKVTRTNQFRQLLETFFPFGK